ncbi:MAG TPA: hypothetical protein DCP28_00085, partial [Cytophagales bacterium]|nr:hypothetical protein [Cytophagales bacterium]
MKRIALLAGMVVLGVGALAQPSAVNKADRFRQVPDLAQAKENIDLAIEHEKTMGKGRTWFVYGQVHEDIFNSEDPTVQALDEMCLEHAITGYEKTIEIEREGSNYHTLAGFQLENIWGGLLNRGATAYQDGDNENALKWFDKAKLVKPEDTTAYLYAGISAQGIDDIPAALENFRTLVELGYSDVAIYNSIIYYTKNFEKDTLGALDWTRKAREQFPSDDDLRKQEVNLLIETNQLDDARAGIVEAIEAEPDNANLYFNLGYLYETEGDDEKALENYRKAVEIDPEYFDAVYNIGVYYYNTAADLYKEANELTISEYNKRGKEIEEEARVNLRESMPFMESASELRPEEPIIWNTLSTIYTRLDMGDKAEAAYNKYEELAGG